MSTLLAEIVPLALAAAISPVIFLLQLNTLTGPRPIARGLVLTAGAAIMLIVLSAIGVALGGTGFSSGESLRAVINIVLGALLAAVGLRALLRPPKPKASEPDTKPLSISRSFLMGAGGMASNVTTFALYIPALALIAGSGLPLGQRAVAALIILVIALMVAWVPLVLAAAVPSASNRLLPALGRWMAANSRWIQVALGFRFGIWLVAKGLNALRAMLEKLTFISPVFVGVRRASDRELRNSLRLGVAVVFLHGTPVVMRLERS
jgi:cytochrome c biogenesis protein CcdA